MEEEEEREEDSVGVQTRPLAGRARGCLQQTAVQTQQRQQQQQQVTWSKAQVQEQEQTALERGVLGPTA